MVKQYLIIIVAFLAIGCKQSQTSQLTTNFTVDGKAEKGMLQFGSPVTFHGLDANWTVQPGNNATAYITDQLGNYSSSVSLAGASYGAVNAQGYYFNENTGSISQNRINLWSYLLPDTGPNNINVATYVIMPRVKALVQSGQTMQAAIDQASAEFAQESLGFTYGTGANSWTITDTSPLLAISTIIQQGRSEQAIESLIGDIGLDLADGTLNSANKSILVASAVQVNIAQVISNTNTYLTSLGGGSVNDPTGWFVNVDPSRTILGLQEQGIGAASFTANMGQGPFYFVVPFTVSAQITLRYASYQCDSQAIQIHSVDPRLGGNLIVTGTASNGALPIRDYNGVTPGNFQNSFPATTLAAGNYFALVPVIGGGCNLSTYEATPHSTLQYTTDLVNYINFGSGTINLRLFGE